MDFESAPRRTNDWVNAKGALRPWQVAEAPGCLARGEQRAQQLVDVRHAVARDEDVEELQGSVRWVAVPACDLPKCMRGAVGIDRDRVRRELTSALDVEVRRNGGGGEVAQVLGDDDSGPADDRSWSRHSNRDNYRLRMLLIGGGLTSPHLK